METNCVNVCGWACGRRDGWWVGGDGKVGKRLQNGEEEIIVQNPLLVEQGEGYSNAGGEGLAGLIADCKCFKDPGIWGVGRGGGTGQRDHGV